MHTSEDIYYSNKHIVSSSVTGGKRPSVLFISKYTKKEGDIMAKAKYTKDSKGYFQTKVWDGTYTNLGKKHYITLRTTKSSKELERMVIEHSRKVEERQYVKKTEITFVKYARTWREV